MKTRGSLAACEDKGGLFQEPTPITTPMRSRLPGWSGFGGLGFSTAGGMGWINQGQGAQLEMLWS